MRTLMTSFHGNPNIGLFAYVATRDGKEICLLGERLSLHGEQELAETMQAEIRHLTAAGTPMPGVFFAGNAAALLVPGIIFPKERTELERLGLPVTLFETQLTCLGNNLLVNDHGCLVNPEFTDEEIARLRALLKVPVKRITIAGLDTPGACVVLHGNKGVIHRDAEPHEIEMVRDTLRLEAVEPASVNLGSPYLKAGIIAGRNGLVVGDQSGGPEVVHLEESLGYLEGRR